VILAFALLHLSTCIIWFFAEARRPMGGRAVLAHDEALPLISTPSAKKGKLGAKALRKTGVAQAPHSTSVRGHG
jgi:hypothetical protein